MRYNKVKNILLLIGLIIPLGVLLVGCEGIDSDSSKDKEVIQETKEELKQEIKEEVKEELEKEKSKEEYRKEPIEIKFDIMDGMGKAITIIGSVRNNTDKEMVNYIVKFDFYKDGNIIHTEEVLGLEPIPANGGYNGEIFHYTENITVNDYDEIKGYIAE